MRQDQEGAWCYCCPTSRSRHSGRDRAVPGTIFRALHQAVLAGGITTRVRLGTTVLVVPYRHPLLVARMAGNLDELSGGRLVLGVGAGGARHELEALGVPFAKRGRLTDEYLATLQQAWGTQSSIPLWVGRNSAAAIRPSIKFGAAWHPLRVTLPFLRDAVTSHALPALRPPSRCGWPAHRSATPGAWPAASSRSSTISARSGGSAPAPSCSTLTTAIRRRPAGPTWPGARSPP